MGTSATATAVAEASSGTAASPGGRGSAPAAISVAPRVPAVKPLPPPAAPRVLVRCRPPCVEDVGARDGSTGGSTSGSTHRAVNVLDSTSLEVRDPALGTLIRRFAVDSAYGEASKTGDVFSSMRGLAHRAAQGGTSAVIAYGPTGAGKTHTMYGDIKEPGIVSLAAAELLHKAAGRPVHISMLELHNEGLSDLLVQKTPADRLRPVASSSNGPPLEVRGGTGGTMPIIEGAREVTAATVASCLSTIRTGLARRQVAATMVNATSSRSHVVVVLRCGTGSFTLVDLAGVERVKRSGAEGSILKEAQSINRSLQSIGDVVDALRRGANHVPVRNSRLARLISGALGGGAETTVLVCVSPESGRRDEAVAALCFADRVRRIPAKEITPAPAPKATRP